MSIDRYAGETGEFDVYSESGSVYRVCPITETCDCSSAKYDPDGACKHLRRVEMELGQRDVPELDQETDVEMIAAREQYRGLGDSTVEHQPADDAVVVTDGGVATEVPTQDTDVEARITGPWTEPAEQGRADYWQCEDCGRESLCRGDLERSEGHAKGCALR